MIATTVGLMTLIQALWLQRREPKPFLRTLGWTALGAVVVQGLLGGLTVLFLLPNPISISHAALAEIFLSINVSIAFFASSAYPSFRARSGSAPDYRLLTRLLEGADEEWMRETAERWLRQLDALDQMDRLDALLAEYHRRAGVRPGSWLDLVRARWLPGIPVDPAGHPTTAPAP